MDRRSFLKLFAAAGPVAAVAPYCLREPVAPEVAFPTFEEIQPRMITLLEQNNSMSFVEQMLSDPDTAVAVGSYMRNMPTPPGY